MTDTLTRQGLPGEWRVLLARYPRESWTGHDNFSGLAAFWLDRHLMFRDLSARLVRDAEDFATQNDPQTARNLVRVTGFMLDQLHAHHMIEDHHLFPLLSPLDHRLTKGFTLLERDHLELGDHIAGLRAQTLPINGQETDAAAREIGERLALAHAAFQRFMHRHLEDEEELVVPVILEYAPDELMANG